MTTTPADRRPYNPDDDKRRDPVKRGRCGRAWCPNPAGWVWTDAAGRTRHECNQHAGAPSAVEDGDERVREGLRRENNGLVAQRLAAITARYPMRQRRGQWMIHRAADGTPTSMSWAMTMARV